jgi:hypothetical protein
MQSVALMMSRDVTPASGTRPPTLIAWLSTSRLCRGSAFASPNFITDLLFNCFIAQVFRCRENHRGFECGEGENVD